MSWRLLKLNDGCWYSYFCCVSEHFCSYLDWGEREVRLEEGGGCSAGDKIRRKTSIKWCPLSSNDPHRPWVWKFWIRDNKLAGRMEILIFIPCLPMCDFVFGKITLLAVGIVLIGHPLSYCFLSWLIRKIKRAQETVAVYLTHCCHRPVGSDPSKRIEVFLGTNELFWAACFVKGHQDLCLSDLANLNMVYSS